MLKDLMKKIDNNFMKRQENFSKVMGTIQKANKNGRNEKNMTSEMVYSVDRFQKILWQSKSSVTLRHKQEIKEQL